MLLLQFKKRSALSVQRWSNKIYPNQVLIPSKKDNLKNNVFSILPSGFRLLDSVTDTLPFYTIQQSALILPQSRL